MIRYNLRCDGGHEFEAWFRSSEDFDAQSSVGLVECVSCGSHDVARALMAPAVVGTRSNKEATAAPASEEGTPNLPSRAVTGAAMPDSVRALLARMRTEIERHCEDVGRDFADEALRMHRGEAEMRGIYGEASDAEREALADEGVEIARIPWLPRSDS